MNLKKFIVRKLLERWVANEPNTSVQGVMNKADVLLWEDGRCRVGLELEEQHMNTRQVLHTGMAILIADVTCALALFSHPKVIGELTYPFPSRAVPSTVNLNFSFLDTSASPGNKIVVNANLRTIQCLLTNNANAVHVDGPLASLDVFIINAESNVLLVKGDMLMHIGALSDYDSKSD